MLGTANQAMDPTPPEALSVGSGAGHRQSVLWTDATDGVRSSHGARVFNVQTIKFDNVEGVQSYRG